MATMAKTAAPVELDYDAIFAKAKKRALGGGMAGAAAMGVNILTMMWLRTTMNFQYRFGMSTREALVHIYNDGGRGISGIRRFYRGLGPAIFQGPLSRFGDTAANTGAQTLLNAHPTTKDWHQSVKTLAASACASVWRIFLMPIDACKSSLQVNGKEGLQILGAKIKAGGPFIMWHGGGAAAGATFVGHFPWFFTFNYLNDLIPKPSDDEKLKKLGRRAAIGFTSSVVSDCCSNSIRVCKTYRQTSSEVISYPQIVKTILQNEGPAGLFGRGLKTRILANGLQGLTFTVLWKYFEEHIQKAMEG